MATPTRAVEAASWRSATRMSGRRRSRPAGSPTAVICGSVRQLARRVPAASSSALGSRPVSTLRRWMERAMAASSGPMVASVPDSCDWAREVSSSVPRPASSRTWVSCSVSRWLSTLRRATASCVCCTAQLEVGARHLRGDRHLRVAQRGLRALRPRALLRFDVAAHATEEVELPERIEARRRRSAASSGAPRRAARPAGTAPWCSRRTAVTVGARSNCASRRIGARLDQMPERDAQVVIGIQRLIDQAVEGGIAELRPEFRLRLLARVRRRLLAPANCAATGSSGFT